MLADCAQVLVAAGGKLLTLVYQGEGAGQQPEEVILRGQGYMVESKLPPVRTQR